MLVTEEYVRKRLMGLISRNLRRCFGLFAWRVAVAGLLLEASKAGVRALVRRRGPRVKAVVNFILDAALPTAYFGPALGIWHGVVHLLPRNATPRTGRPHIDQNNAESQQALNAPKPREEPANQPIEASSK